MNIGDRVLADGKLGTITEIVEGNYMPYTVGFMDGGWDVFKDDSVHLVAKANYTLA